MTAKACRAWLEAKAENGGGFLTMDGYDDCIAGLCYRAGTEPFIVYDRAKVLKKIMKRDGMTREEAHKFHDFNQADAWIGPRTPGFIDHPE